AAAPSSGRRATVAEGPTPARPAIQGSRVVGCVARVGDVARIGSSLASSRPVRIEKPSSRHRDEGSLRGSTHIHLSIKPMPAGTATIIVNLICAVTGATRATILAEALR